MARRPALHSQNAAASLLLLPPFPVPLRIRESRAAILNVLLQQCEYILGVQYCCYISHEQQGRAINAVKLT